VQLILAELLKKQPAAAIQLRKLHRLHQWLTQKLTPNGVNA
jgi:hypothetical protein